MSSADTIEHELFHKFKLNDPDLLRPEWDSTQTVFHHSLMTTLRKNAYESNDPTYSDFVMPSRRGLVGPVACLWGILDW